MARFTFRTFTDHTLMFFTNLGNCYTLSVGKLEEANRPATAAWPSAACWWGWRMGNSA